MRWWAEELASALGEALGALTSFVVHPRSVAAASAGVAFACYFDPTKRLEMLAFALICILAVSCWIELWRLNRRIDRALREADSLGARTVEIVRKGMRSGAFDRPIR